MVIWQLGQLVTNFFYCSWLSGYIFYSHERWFDTSLYYELLLILICCVDYALLDFYSRYVYSFVNQLQSKLIITSAWLAKCPVPQILTSGCTYVQCWRVRHVFLISIIMQVVDAASANLSLIRLYPRLELTSDMDVQSMVGLKLTPTGVVIVKVNKVFKQQH